MGGVVSEHSIHGGGSVSTCGRCQEVKGSLDMENHLMFTPLPKTTSCSTRCVTSGYVILRHPFKTYIAALVVPGRSQKSYQRQNEVLSRPPLAHVSSCVLSSAAFGVWKCAFNRGRPLQNTRQLNPNNPFWKILEASGSIMYSIEPKLL